MLTGWMLLIFYSMLSFHTVLYLEGWTEYQEHFRLAQLTPPDTKLEHYQLHRCYCVQCRTVNSSYCFVHPRVAPLLRRSRNCWEETFLQFFSAKSLNSLPSVHFYARPTKVTERFICLFVFLLFYYFIVYMYFIISLGVSK